MFPTETNIRTPFHIDILKAENFKSYTGIYYVNTNDGYTSFENGDTYNSVENRLITFPSHLRHAGSTPSNTKARFVINFNYFQ